MLASWAVQAPDNAPKRLQDPIPWNFYVEGVLDGVGFWGYIGPSGAAALILGHPGAMATHCRWVFTHDILNCE